MSPDAIEVAGVRGNAIFISDSRLVHLHDRFEIAWVSTIPKSRKLAWVLIDVTDSQKENE